MIEQFTDGTLSGWNLELSIGSITGSQFPSQPTADPAKFMFPLMPSGKPGLRVHSGSYHQPKQEGIIGFEGGKVINTYTLTKRITSAGGITSMKIRCQGNRKAEYAGVYVSTDFVGSGLQVASASGTTWKTLNFEIPTGECQIFIIIHPTVIGADSDVWIDEFTLPV